MMQYLHKGTYNVIRCFKRNFQNSTLGMIHHEIGIITQRLCPNNGTNTNSIVILTTNRVFVFLARCVRIYTVLR